MSYEFEFWKKTKTGYEVSNYGRIKSVDRYVKHKNGHTALKKGKILKPNYYKDGYAYANMHIDGKYKRLLISRLVAEAFIPNPYKLPEVNHKDEDKHNNCVWNLQWCTKKFNCNYGTRNIRIGTSRHTK